MGRVAGELSNMLLDASMVRTKMRTAYMILGISKANNGFVKAVSVRSSLGTGRGWTEGAADRK